MRKKFFVTPRLQLKHLTWTLLTAICSCGIGYFIFEGITASIFQSSPLPPEDWFAMREGLRMAFIITLVLFVAAIGLEHYFLFHRVAGPLYVLQKGLDQAIEGNYEGEIHLRNDDDLKDLISSFERLKRRLREEIKDSEKMRDRLGQDLEEILKSGSLEKIKDLKERLHALHHKSEKKAA